jgi:hypothetical protein
MRSEPSALSFRRIVERSVSDQGEWVSVAESEGKNVGIKGLPQRRKKYPTEQSQTWNKEIAEKRMGYPESADH